MAVRFCSAHPLVNPKAIAMADAFLRDASCPKQCALDHLCHLHLEMFAPLHRMPISWRAQQMLQICTRTTAAVQKCMELRAAARLTAAHAWQRAWLIEGPVTATFPACACCVLAT